MPADARLIARATLLALFFCWGVVAVLLRLSVPHLKAAFDLGYRDALLVQSSFFITYLLLARISGGFIARSGFRRGVSIGLALMAAGTMALVIVTEFGQFVALLHAVFVIACGVTFLQVAANSLAAEASGTRSAAANLTLAQACNSLGTVAAPFLAAWAFAANPLPSSMSELQSLRTLFLGVGLTLTALSLISLFTLRALPDADGHQDEAPIPPGSRRRLAAGVGAIFLYVGGEVAITSTLVNLLEADWSLHVGRIQATRLAALFWVGMLAGRLVGSQWISRVRRGHALAATSTVATLLIAVAASTSGALAAASLLLLGIAYAIQFPTIFAIATTDLTVPQRARAAGWLCTGIVGGAIMPLAFGMVADRAGLQSALVVPGVCAALVTGFGLIWSDRPRQSVASPLPPD